MLEVQVTRALLLGAPKEEEAPFWASRQQAAGSRQQTDSPAGRQAGRYQVMSGTIQLL